MKAASSLFALILALSAPLAHAQAPSSGSKSASPVVQTFYLKNATQPNDISEVITTVRNMLPQDVRVYAVASQNAIVLEASEEQFELARKIIDALDLPRKAFHLTYTITEVDGTHRLPAQHASMNLVAGQAATLQQGTRVPIITSNATTDPANSSSHYTYVDVGLLVTATVSPVAAGGVLKTRFEQSGIAAEHTTPSIQNPNIHQTMLENFSVVHIGKTIGIGSLDLPGTTHHLEIEALLEPMP